MLEIVRVAELQVVAATKQAVVADLERRLQQGQKVFLTTLYSEFLYWSLKNQRIARLLNRADVAVADGIAIPWAYTFLHMPLTNTHAPWRWCQTVWQYVYSGASIILRPSFVKRRIPETIVGADFIGDLCQLAINNHYSVYLLGGFGRVTKQAAAVLQARYPGLTVAGSSHKNPEDESIMQDLARAKPDLLFVAYGPIRQEEWIVRHFSNLPVQLAVGLGGTFDYLAGEKWQPPRFFRKSGLEWLFRLLTQPRRFKRIFRATFGLSWELMKYKLRSL